MDDDQIVELYLARDEAAVAETAKKYGSALRSMANSVLKDASAAEECEYDAYLEAWNLIPPHEPRTYLYPFLGRIVRHIAIDRCRQNSASKRSALFCELTSEMEECLPGSGSVEASAEESELIAAINAYLGGCRADKRRMFVRRYWYFDTVAEISIAQGVSKAKVKTALFRMRKELKEFLKKEGYTI